MTLNNNPGAENGLILQEEFLTIPEIARILRVKPSAVYRYITKGRLPAYRFGGQKKTIRIKREDFEAFQTMSLISIK